MKSATTLKELVKPPFERNGRSIYDGAGRLLAVLETFGKGFVVEQDKTNATGDFVVTALNEKWERDFSKPLRWRKQPQSFGGVQIINCPICGYQMPIYSLRVNEQNYCSHCGQRLLPQEGGTN